MHQEDSLTNTIKSKKIGDDFGGAKIKRGHHFMYAIKKDGSLWEGNFDNENSLSFLSFTKITEIDVKDKLYTPNKIDSLSKLLSIMEKIPYRIELITVFPSLHPIYNHAIIKI